MPKFAANLAMLFNEIPFLDRFDAAAEAGFAGVEFRFPCAFPAAEIKSRVRANGLELVLHNLPAGNWEAGERGIACMPDRVDEFRAGVARALEYASALGVWQLNCLVGKVPQGVDEATARRTLVSNLRHAASELKKSRVKLLVEPINTFDIPGFYLNRTDQGLQLMDEVDSDNIWLRYDIYHMQRMEGELARTIEANLARIAHIQLADNPGRNEPGTGEINYSYLLARLDQIRYQGWIGCEYKPATFTAARLGWRDRISM